MDGRGVVQNAPSWPQVLILGSAGGCGKAGKIYEKKEGKECPPTRVEKGWCRRDLSTRNVITVGDSSIAFAGRRIITTKSEGREVLYKKMLVHGEYRVCIKGKEVVINWTDEGNHPRFSTTTVSPFQLYCRKHCAPVRMMTGLSVRWSL